jgi:hypothetical protein
MVLPPGEPRQEETLQETSDLAGSERKVDSLR